MLPHKGSWFGLPDFGLTEKLTSNRTAQGGSNLFGSGGSVLGASAPVSGGVNYSNQIPATFQAPKTTPVAKQNLSQQGGGGLPQTQDFTQTFTEGIEEPNQEIELINQEFNNFQNYLGQQESMSRQNFADTQGLFDTQKASAEAQLGADKTSQETGIKKTESLNLAKVRQLLGELQQGNAARSAITGASGSANEALAERFGKRAQEGLGNVMNQTQQAMERVNSFYNQAKQKISDSYNTNLMNAKQMLDQNLAEISYQKGQSATAKQQQTLSAWRNYYDNLNQAKLQAAQFQAQYDMWKQQQDTAYSAWGAQSEQSANQYNMLSANSLDKGLYSPAQGAPGVNSQVNLQYGRNFLNRTSPQQEEDEETPLGDYGTDFYSNLGQ
jgi:hypothetical protein